MSLTIKQMESINQALIVMMGPNPNTEDGSYPEPECLDLLAPILQMPNPSDSFSQYRIASILGK